MIHLPCSLLGCVLLVGLAHADGEDLSAQAPVPNPRLSGQGRVAFAASNVNLLGWLTLGDFPGGNTTGNDCWGYTSPSGREYALMGLSNGTAFVEVTDPGAPRLVDFEPGVPNFWRCLKVYQHHAYAGSEGGGGLQVFDLANIDAGSVQLVSTVTTGGCTTGTHTLAVDEVSGFLYRAGGHCAGERQGLVIYDLADPALPAYVATWSGRYVHEAQVVTWDVPGLYFGRQIAFLYTQGLSGSGSPMLQILDVTNKAAITTLASRTYPSASFSHQGWTSADKLHLYLNDEQDDTSFGPSRTRIFGIANLAAPSYLGFFSSGAGSIDHNLYAKGNRVYEGNYTSGLRIFDDTNPAAPVQVGFFDTRPEDDAQSFNSLWSNYPFFASGTLLGGDIERGLFVWREGPPELVLAFPAGAPEFIEPASAPLQFTVSENVPGDLAAGTVRLHCVIGGVFTATDATALGGDLYEAALPAMQCGTEFAYYLSAQSSAGVTWTDPPAAPTQAYLAVAARGETLLYADAMESNLGWSVNLAADLVGFTTATSGSWGRTEPIGTAAQPEVDHTSAPGFACWFTGQGPAGGALGDADVDGGATSLRSPVLDASGVADPYLSYWRWFSNNQGPGPGEDVLTVDISNDGGASWVPLETVGPTGLECGGGWFRHSARIAAFVPPSNNMRLRFRASDLGTGSIVEAALDDLALYDYDCGPSLVSLSSIAPASGPFEGGNVITLTGDGFRAGQTRVRFGPDLATAVHYVSPTTLRVRVPRAGGPVSGKTGRADLRVDVTVEDPGSATLPQAYTFELPRR